MEILKIYSITGWQYFNSISISDDTNLNQIGQSFSHNAINTQLDLIGFKLL